MSNGDSAAATLFGPASTSSDRPSERIVNDSRAVRERDSALLPTIVADFQATLVERMKASASLNVTPSELLSDLSKVRAEIANAPAEDRERLETQEASLLQRIDNYNRVVSQLPLARSRRNGAICEPCPACTACLINGRRRDGARERPR